MQIVRYPNFYKITDDDDLLHIGMNLSGRSTGDLNRLFYDSMIQGKLPQLSPWEEVELYRIFNGGNLPNTGRCLDTHVEYRKGIVQRGEVFSVVAFYAIASHKGA